MITVLLEQIIEILKGWLSSFTDFAERSLAALGYLEEIDETVDNIDSNVSDIKDNIESIQSNVSSINVATTGINNRVRNIDTNVNTITNNITSISANAGVTAAFSEDIATNTLNTLDKVTTIASDTTQMRSNTNNIYTDVDEIKTLLRYFSAGLIMEEDSEGAIVTFDTDLTDYLVNCKCGFSTTKDNNTLSGVSSITVTRAGKNLLSEVERNDLTNNIQFFFTSGLLLKAGTYTWSTSETINWYITDFATSASIVTKYNSNFLTFTLSEDTRVKFNTYKVGINHSDVFMLTLGSEIAEYEPYNGITQTVNLGSTYYGGELDALNGRLKVTHGYIASYNGETINEPWISSLDDYVPNTTPTTGAEVVYPLTTPYYVAVNDIAIKTLKGVNNVYNDCDSTFVTYKETVKHYLEKQEG